MLNVLGTVGDSGDCEVPRLRALTSFHVAGTGPEPRFDRIVRLAVDLFEVPIAFVSLVEQERQWFKSRVGLEASETPREASFCTYTIESDAVLVIPDTHLDPRFSRLPLVMAAPFIRFYAGAPLVTAEGYRLGALCIADTRPRKRFSARQSRALRDLAALVMEQLELRRSERVRADMLGFADATELALIAISPNGIINFANRSVTTLFGYEQNEMIGSPIDIIIPDRLRGAHHAGMARIAAGGETKLAGKTVEVTARKRDGAEFPIEMALSVWHDERGFGMGAIIRDISERRGRDARLLRLASHDTLTGLYNRPHFEDVLADLFRRREAASVLLLDLDGFKDVNDSLGHAVGDSLLQAVAVRLPVILEGEVVLARFGGDEFAIVLPGAGDPLKAHACASAVLSGFEHPFQVGDHVFQLGASIGFAIAPMHGEDAEELVASADFALYRAKQAGRRCIRMFEPEMRHASVARRATQDELLRAMQKGELELYYQPQVAIEDRHVFGVESLLRWRHPERGLLLPSAFLSAIETSSLSLPVGWWALDEACRQLAEWRAAGLLNLRMGVNLFSAQFRSGTLGLHVVDALERHGLDPWMLELEVTETIALQNDDYSHGQIRELHDMGVGIALDDFGTGYASLGTLKLIPLTTLKIDRGFIQDLLASKQDAAITRAMITMGSELGLQTIAEGVETAEQEAVLRALGCTAAQGYRYGRAMPAGDIAARFLRDPARSARGQFV